MTRADFDTGLEEGIARVRGAPRPLFLQPDVSAGTAWDPFRPADPVPCERPKTKKGRPGKASPLPVSPSVRVARSHEPTHTAGDTHVAEQAAHEPAHVTHR